MVQQTGWGMGMSKTMVKTSLKHVLEHNNKQDAYMFDENGKEIQITAAMIRKACYQLLKQCRRIQS